MDSTVQVLKSSSEVCLVVLPRQTIHTRRGVSFEFEERLSEKIDADVMEERGEFLLLPFLRHFPYALQRLCHVSPVLRPARALLARIPLGPRPCLHRLRRGCRLRGLLRGGLLRFVRRLHSYYDGVRLLVSVHHRLRFLTFPMRTVVLSTWRPDTRSPSFRCDPFARDVVLDPGRASAPRLAVPHMLPSSE